MTNDIISDMLTRIRNGIYARQDKILIQNTKMTSAIANILLQEGFIRQCNVVTSKTSKATLLLLTLKYKQNRPCINHLKRYSKPSLRLYSKYKNIPRILNGMGLVILSTPQGVLSGHEAKRRKVGGEILCSIW